MRLKQINDIDGLLFLIEQSIGSVPSIDPAMVSTYKNSIGPTKSAGDGHKRGYTSAKQMQDNAPRTSTEAQSQQQIDDDFLHKKDVELWKGLVDDAKSIASNIASMGKNKLPVAAQTIKSILAMSAPPGKRWKMTLKENTQPVSIQDFVTKLTGTKISPYTLGLALHAFIKGIIKSAGLSVREVVKYVNNAYGGNRNASSSQNGKVSRQSQSGPVPDTVAATRYSPLGGQVG